MTRRPTTIAPTEPVEAAATLMNGCRVRHLPVVEGEGGSQGGGRLTGVLSLRDVVSAPDGAAVAEVMARLPTTVLPDTPLGAACERMLTGRFSCLPVVQDDRLLGIFTGTDALRFALAALTDEACLLGREPLVTQLMTARPLILVSPRASLRDAWKMMTAARVRHAPVMSGEQIIGILSDRDVLAAGRAWLDDDTPERAMLVADAMSTRLSTIEAERPAVEAATTLLRRRVGALPVMRGGALVGIVTVSDFLYWILSRV